MPVPDHLNYFTYDIEDDNTFAPLRDMYTSSRSSVMQVGCICGNMTFRAMSDANPVVTAVCSECGQQILVYDPDEYTNSEGRTVPDSEVRRYVSPSGKELFELAVNFEYDKDPDDPEFDPNAPEAFSLFAYCRETDEKTTLLGGKVK